jgi:hypothetical protein
MTKEEAYSKLFELSNNGIDINEQITELAISNEVPESVINFLNDQSSNYLEFLDDLRDKKFYKTLTESSDPMELSKALSSMITHTLIEMQNHPDKKSVIKNNLNIAEILESLNDYILNNNEEKLMTTVRSITKLLRKD